jgi:ABC-type glutathione transport system ATPase component
LNQSTPIIEFDAVDVTYQVRSGWKRSAVRAVSGVSLAIAPGETVGLVGQSGSGKTTLGRVALGLVAPTHGTLRFEGAPMDARLRRPGTLAVVFQHPEWALNPRLRSGLSIAEPLAVEGFGDSALRHQRVQEMLDQVGLGGDLARRYPGELSGGQRQRMAIARALITRPRFVVFDEAVSALDVSVQSQVLNLIRRLQGQYGFASLFISHNLAATRYVSHRVAVMLRGELVELAPASRFYGTPEHAYSKALLASID